MNGEAANSVALLDELEALPADRRLSRVQQRGPVEQVVSDLIEQASRLTATDAARALVVSDMVMRLADDGCSKLAQARARRARARALSYGGRFEESLSVCRDGVRLAEEAGSRTEAGRAKLASMHALGELGLLDEAIAAGQAAREAFIAAGDAALAARADINIGIAHQRRDDPATALTCFDRARPSLLQEPLIVGHLDNSRGEALLALHDFRGAEAAFSAALEAFEHAEAGLTAAIAEGNLADLAARQGRLQDSLYRFERARRKLARDATPGHLARLRSEQAEAMSVLGMPADALLEYEAALPELDRSGLALEAARARMGMGMALIRLGRLAQAETALAAAAVGFEEIGHATARARVDLARAQIAASNGRAAEARSMLLRALGTFRDRSPEAAAARQHLGRLAMESGLLEEANADLSIAISIARELDLPPLLADVHLSLGLLRRREGRLNEAISEFSAAIEQTERVRGALQAERFRAAYLGSRTGQYEWLVASILDQDAEESFGKAFEAAERCKSRALLESVQATLDGVPAVDRHAEDTEHGDLLAELATTRSELNGLYSRLADDQVMSGAMSASGWREAVRRREERLSSIENRLAMTQGAGSLYAQTASLSAVTESVGDGALVEYFIAGEELMAFVIHAGHTSVLRSLADIGEVKQSLERVQFQITRALRPGALTGARADRLTDAARIELAALYDLVMRPVRATIEGAARLTIVPHGPLHLVPFHALHDGGQYLLEAYEIHSSPSASLLHHLRQRAGSPRGLGRALIVGVPDETAPQIAEEAELVRNVLESSQTRLLVGASATVDQVVRGVQDADIIHMACHGRYASETPLGSGLRLSDRWLTVRDIYGLRLRADLVTLSACESGVNLVNAGDELIGLLRGFFAAGASTLMVTLWRVDDQTTMEFMPDFYRCLRTMSETQTRTQWTVARVVREAQLRLMAAHPHPALWAPFVVVGRE